MDNKIVIEVPVNNIKQNPYQIRDEIRSETLQLLINSIRERGLFNPITVIKESKDSYVVVSGHRRLEAFKKMKKKTIPAFVKKRDTNNSLLIDLVHENLIREDLTVQEKALSIKALFSQIPKVKNNIDEIISCITVGKLFTDRQNKKQNYNLNKFTSEEMFSGIKYLKQIGISANNAICYLNVLKLPPSVQHMVSFNVHNDKGERSSKRISIKMANTLARVDDKDFQKVILKRALTGSSARSVDAAVSDYKAKVLKGEWKGVVKKTANSRVLKEFSSKSFYELAEKFENLSKIISSWKLSVLPGLVDYLDKDIFITSATALRKELRILDNNLLEHLKEKNYIVVEDHNLNEPFEIRITESRKKKMCRGTIPINILRKIGYDIENLKGGDFIQLKIIGIRKQIPDKLEEVDEQAFEETGHDPDYGR